MTDRCFEITIYDKCHGDHWAQHRYHVSGFDDVLWTCDPTEALRFLQESIRSTNLERVKELGLEI